MLLSTPLRAFYLTLLALSWLLCSVVAAPVGHGASSSGLRPSAVTFMNWLRNNAATLNARPICFYSGTTGTVPAFDAMESFSPKMNCNYMKTALKMAKANTGGWRTNTEWAAVSRALAAVAENTPVYVLLGHKVLTTSVWINKEKPKLQERLSAQKIQTVAVYNFSGQEGSFVFTPAGNLEP